MSDAPVREPFRLAIPLLLILAVPLAHLTATGVALLETGWVLVGLGGAAFAVFMIFSGVRSEEHTSELQSQSTISYAVFCLKKKKKK